MSYEQARSNEEIEAMLAALKQKRTALEEREVTVSEGIAEMSIAYRTLGLEPVKPSGRKADLGRKLRRKNGKK